MLSHDIGETLGETLSVAWNAIAIKDEQDVEIDINGFIKSKLNALITSIIGAENYESIKTTLNKVNRIHQAAMLWVR